MSQFDLAAARKQLENLESLRAYMASTREDQWNLDTVRSADGERNCFFGHLFNYGQQLALNAGSESATAEKFANRMWEAFEDMWTTTYYVYPINDGKNPKYLQETPRQRCLALLDALWSGEEETTEQSMERQYRHCLAVAAIVSNV